MLPANVNRYETYTISHTGTYVAPMIQGQEYAGNKPFTVDLRTVGRACMARFLRLRMSHSDLQPEDGTRPYSARYGNVRVKCK